MSSVVLDNDRSVFSQNKKIHDHTKEERKSCSKSLDTFLVNFFNQRQCLLLPRCIYQHEENTLIPIFEPNALPADILESITPLSMLDIYDPFGSSSLYEYDTPLLLTKKSKQFKKYNYVINDKTQINNCDLKKKQEPDVREQKQLNNNNICTMNRCMWDTEVITRENSIQPDTVSIIWSIPLDFTLNIMVGIFCSAECASAFDYQYFRGRNQHHIKKLRKHLFENCKDEKIKLLGSFTEPLYSAPPCYYLDKFQGPLTLEIYRNLYNAQSKVIKRLKCVMKEPRWHVTDGSMMITDIMPLEINIRKRKRYTPSTHTNANNFDVNMFQSRRGLMYQEIDLCPFPYKIVKHKPDIFGSALNSDSASVVDVPITHANNHQLNLKCVLPNVNKETTKKIDLKDNNCIFEQSLDKTVNSFGRLAYTKCVPYVKHTNPQDNTNSTKNTTQSLSIPTNTQSPVSTSSQERISVSSGPKFPVPSSVHRLKSQYNNEKKHVYQKVVSHSFQNSVQIASGKSTLNQNHQTQNSLSSQSLPPPLPPTPLRPQPQPSLSSRTLLLDEKEPRRSNEKDRDDRDRDDRDRDDRDRDDRDRHKYNYSCKHQDYHHRSYKSQDDRRVNVNLHINNHSHVDAQHNSNSSRHHKLDRNRPCETYSNLPDSNRIPSLPISASTSSAKTLFQPSRSAARVRKSCEKNVNYEIAKRNCFKQLY